MRRCLSSAETHSLLEESKKRIGLHRRTSSSEFLGNLWHQTVTSRAVLDHLIVSNLCSHLSGACLLPEGRLPLAHSFVQRVALQHPQATRTCSIRNQMPPEELAVYPVLHQPQPSAHTSLLCSPVPTSTPHSSRQTNRNRQKRTLRASIPSRDKGAAGSCIAQAEGAYRRRQRVSAITQGPSSCTNGSRSVRDARAADSIRKPLKCVTLETAKR